MLYLAYFLLTVHMLVGMFLIGLILLQRGRGGGLAGAFGGMGGQSAFGTKAGDIFTRITIAVALIWILLACICILVVNSATKGRATFVDKAAAVTPSTEDKAIDLDMPDKASPPNGNEQTGETEKEAANDEANETPHVDAKPASVKVDSATEENPRKEEKAPSTENPDTTKPE